MRFPDRPAWRLWSQPLVVEPRRIQKPSETLLYVPLSTLTLTIRPLTVGLSTVRRKYCCTEHVSIKITAYHVISAEKSVPYARWRIWQQCQPESVLGSIHSILREEQMPSSWCANRHQLVCKGGWV